MKPEYILYVFIALLFLAAFSSCDNDGIPVLSPGSGAIYEQYYDEFLNNPIGYEDLYVSDYTITKDNVTIEAFESEGYFGDMEAVVWYRIYMSYESFSERTYVFESKGDLDLVGKLYKEGDESNSLGEEVAENDDGGTDGNFKISYKPYSSGYYFLRVTPFDEEESGEFDLDYYYHTN